MKKVFALAALALAIAGGPAAAAELEAQRPLPPRIRVTASFSPNAILAGQATTFSWNATGGASFCDISGVPGLNFGGSSGTFTLSPSSSLQANVTCEGPVDGSTGVANATLTVQPGNTAPVVNAAYTPASIYTGQSSTFSWSSQYATSCSSTGGVAVGTTSGSTSVAPTASQSTTVTCTGPGGSTARTANLSVSPPPPPLPVINAYASPNWLSAPGWTWLHWSTSHATGCNWGGAFGSTYRYYSFTTADWITCYGPGGSSSRAVWVYVNGRAAAKTEAVADLAALGLDLGSAQFQHGTGDFDNDGQEDLLVVDVAARQAHLLFGQDGRYGEIARTVEGVDRLEDVIGIQVPTGRDAARITLQLQR